jgi:hypothetical protein
VAAGLPAQLGESGGRGPGGVELAKEVRRGEGQGGRGVELVACRRAVATGAEQIQAAAPSSAVRLGQPPRAAANARSSGAGSGRGRRSSR